MTNLVNKNYDSALLAEAAYADLSNITNKQMLEDRLVNGGLTENQAKYIVDNYELVVHL